MGISVTEDEADKKRKYERIMQQRQRLDVSTLDNPNPAKRYKWVNNRPRGVARAERLGFEKTDPKGETTAVFGVAKDGVITLGPGSDVILMEEPMELYEAKRQADAETLAAQVKGINEAAKEKLNRIARDEGRARPHQDIVEDISVQGETVTVKTRR